MSDQGSEINNINANSRRSHYCHQCRRTIEALMAPDPTCPICNGNFVEEVGDSSDLRDAIEHGGGGHESEDEYDETIQFPVTTNGPNGPDLFQQLYQMISNLPNVRVQTERRDGNTTTITATTETTTTTEGGAGQQGQQDGNRQQQQPHRPNFIFAMGGSGNAPNAVENPFLQLFQRILEGGGANNTNFLNFFNLAGDPADYAWGNTSWDNIITQLMEQQTGRQAPPPATEEVIENLPKAKILKKQVVEEQLGCPVCKDEFKTDEEAVSLPCDHTFHYECIKPWLKVNGTCPVCRYSLVQENKEQNEQNNNGAGSSNNSGNNLFSPNSSSLPGTYPGNQQNNNGQQNQDDHMDLD